MKKTYQMGEVEIHALRDASFSVEGQTITEGSSTAMFDGFAEEEE